MTKGTACRRVGVRSVSKAVAAFFLIMGTMGFIPGISSDYEALRWSAADSGASLLGIFRVSITENLIYFSFGIAALLMSRTHNTAEIFLTAGGLFYLVFALHGLFSGGDNPHDLFPGGSSEVWLQYTLGVGLTTAGILPA